MSNKYLLAWTELGDSEDEIPVHVHYDFSPPEPDVGLYKGAVEITEVYRLDDSIEARVKARLLTNNRLPWVISVMGQLTEDQLDSLADKIWDSING